MRRSLPEDFQAIIDTLGRPADVAELRLWIRAHAALPAASALRGVQIGDRIPRIVKTDRTRSAAGRLLQIAGDRTQGGRAPTRYVDADGVGDFDAATQRCRLLDLVRTLECDTELQEITTLEHRAARLCSPSLSSLATMRRTALTSAMHAVVVRPRTAAGGDCTAALTHVVDRLAESVTVVTVWLGSIAAPARADARTYRRMRVAVDATTRHLAAVRREIGTERLQMPPAVQGVSADTAVELRDLAPFLTAAAREWERPDTPSTHRALTADARVFAAAAPVRITGPRHGAFIARVRVDRVDALAVLYRALPVARAATLIASAQELLGRVIRDVVVVEAVREASRPAVAVGGHRGRAADDHPAVWRAAVVALGLLGVAPAAEDWDIVRGAESHDHAAVCLAAVLADPSTALEPINSLAVRGSRVAAVAVRRVELGRLMTGVG